MNSRIRSWSRRDFYDPAPILRALRLIEAGLSELTIPPLVARLRTNRLKSDREARDALLFAYGMSTVVGSTVFVSPGETEDCDFLTRVAVGETQHFACVQLKELAPDDLNPNQSIDQLLAKLARLPQSDAALAIHLNRRVTIELASLGGRPLPFSDVWYLWAANPEATSWRLFGDANTNPRVYEFEYPR